MANPLTRYLGGICARVGVLAIFLMCSTSYGQPVSESDLKAALLYNFSLFTEWPSEVWSTPDQFNICVNPKNPVYASLISFQGKQVRGKDVFIKPFVGELDPRSCRILFLGAADRDQWRRMRVEGLNKRGSTLTISDSPEFDSEEVMIALVQSNNKIVFDIHLLPAKQAQLELSSKILRLARSIK